MGLLGAVVGHSTLQRAARRVNGKVVQTAHLGPPTELTGACRRCGRPRDRKNSPGLVSARFLLTLAALAVATAGVAPAATASSVGLSLRLFSDEETIAAGV